MDVILTSPGPGWPAGNALGFGANSSVGLLVGHAAVDAASPGSGRMGDEGSGAGIYFESGWIVARERVRTELGFRYSLIPDIYLWDAVEYDGIALHVRTSVPF